MSVNKDWHLTHRMPNPPTGGPTLKQRVVWHIAHAENCVYRPIPSSVQNKIEK